MFDDISGKIAFRKVNGEYEIDFDFFYKEKSLDIKLIYFLVNGEVVYNRKEIIAKFKDYFKISVKKFLNITEVDLLVDKKKDLIKKTDNFYETYIAFIENVLKISYPEYEELFDKVISTITNFRKSPEYVYSFQRFTKALGKFEIIRKSLSWDSETFYEHYRSVYKIKNTWNILSLFTKIDIFKRLPNRDEPEKIVVKRSH